MEGGHSPYISSERTTGVVKSRTSDRCLILIWSMYSISFESTDRTIRSIVVAAVSKLCETIYCSFVPPTDLSADVSITAYVDNPTLCLWARKASNGPSATVIELRNFPICEEPQKAANQRALRSGHRPACLAGYEDVSGSEGRRDGGVVEIYHIEQRAAGYM